MQQLDDMSLVRAFAAGASEAAFETLVTRHISLVHSAAMRQVGDPHLAQEITQAVFIILARKAASLPDGTFLIGWLFKTTRYVASTERRAAIRRKRREEEAHMVSANSETPDETAWSHIAPLLDEALADLNETDRRAVLLRFFERQTLGEVGAALSLNEEAARKRVNRAVEKLRKFFVKRGVTQTATALVAALTANSMQAAPAGLAATISATTLQGAAVAGSVTALVNGTIKTIAMTTAQKTLITVSLVAAVGTGIYQTNQAAALRTEVQALQAQLQTQQSEQTHRLQSDLDDAMRQLVAARGDNERLTREISELPRLRGDAARLRQSQQELAQLTASSNTNDPLKSEVEFMLGRVSQLRKGFEQMPAKYIPELELVRDDNWLSLAQQTRGVDFNTPSGMIEGISEVRKFAKESAASLIQHALRKYTHENGGQLPSDTSGLKSYFNYVVDASIREKFALIKDQTDAAMLQRYQMTKTGNIKDLQPQDTVMTEKGIMDSDSDTLWKIGPDYMWWEGTGANKGRKGSMGGLPPGITIPK